MTVTTRNLKYKILNIHSGATEEIRMLSCEVFRTLSSGPILSHTGEPRTEDTTSGIYEGMWVLRRYNQLVVNLLSYHQQPLL